MTVVPSTPSFDDCKAAFAEATEALNRAYDLLQRSYDPKAVPAAADELRRAETKFTWVDEWFGGIPDAWCKELDATADALVAYHHIYAPSNLERQRGLRKIEDRVRKLRGKIRDF
jgi:hypothetical protein